MWGRPGASHTVPMKVPIFLLLLLIVWFVLRKKFPSKRSQAKGRPRHTHPSCHVVKHPEAEQMMDFAKTFSGYRISKMEKLTGDKRREYIAKEIVLPGDEAIRHATNSYHALLRVSGKAGFFPHDMLTEHHYTLRVLIREGMICNRIHKESADADVIGTAAKQSAKIYYAIEQQHADLERPYRDGHPGLDDYWDFPHFVPIRYTQ